MVGPTDKPDGPVGGVRERPRDVERAEREAALVGDEQRALAGRQVLQATDADVPAQSCERLDDAHEVVVAAPLSLPASAARMSRNAWRTVRFVSTPAATSSSCVAFSAAVGRASS
jgi:hypothetical protein